VSAALDGDRSLVLELLRAGEDPDRGGDLSTPLIAAARGGHTDIAFLLLAYGAEVDRDVGDSWTPLFAAARSGSLDTVQLLLSHGADPCRRTSSSYYRGMRPSAVAAASGFVGVAAFLAAVEEQTCQ
jgi:ankyrin repeat protein